jgi:hypothetical protein
MDSGRSYWMQPLLTRLGLGDQLRLLALVFALVFATVVVLHLFLPERHGPATLLLHAVQISGGYLMWFALLTLGLAAALGNGWLAVVRVWHLWLLSGGCYLLGYFAASFGDALTVALHRDLEQPTAWFHFLRLLPVWLLVTWVFTETYLGRNRRAEIERLLALSASLSGGRSAIVGNGARVTLEQGRTRLDVPAHAVSHVSVDDHYCYVHHVEADLPRKLAIAVPLKELQARLPDVFLQIHRSHVVNVAAVTGLERRGRGYWLQVAEAGSPVWLPVSRHRLDAVLPRLSLESRERSGVADH